MKCLAVKTPSKSRQKNGELPQVSTNFGCCASAIIHTPATSANYIFAMHSVMAALLLLATADALSPSVANTHAAIRLPAVGARRCGSIIAQFGGGPEDRPPPRISPNGPAPRISPNGPGGTRPAQKADDDGMTAEERERAALYAGPSFDFDATSVTALLGVAIAFQFFVLANVNDM